MGRSDSAMSMSVNYQAFADSGGEDVFGMVANVKISACGQNYLRSRKTHSKTSTMLLTQRGKTPHYLILPQVLIQVCLTNMKAVAEVAALVAKRRLHKGVKYLAMSFLVFTWIHKYMRSY